MVFTVGSVRQRQFCNVSTLSLVASQGLLGQSMSVLYHVHKHMFLFCLLPKEYTDNSTLQSFALSEFRDPLHSTIPSCFHEGGIAVSVWREGDAWRRDGGLQNENNSGLQKLL